MRVTKSIKWRIQLWYGVMLVAVLSALGTIAFQLERTKTLRQIDNELMRRGRAVGDAVRASTQRPPRRAAPRSDNPESPRRPAGPRADDESSAGAAFRLQPRDEGLFGEPEGFYFVALGRDGREIARSRNAPDRPFAIAPASRPGGAQIAPAMHGSVRELRYETGQGDQILVGRDIAAELSDLRVTAIKLTTVSGIILLIALAGGWWIAARSLRPISAISSTATRIASGDLTRRIDVGETESELGQLAAVLNSTFARLESAFAQQKQFASDAAHELRTPVTVLITQTQSALSRERAAADYRETIEACQRAAQRMRRLIGSLLELARFDAGQEVLNRTRFDLSALAAETVELVAPLAEERKVRVISEIPPLEMNGDADRLGQVLSNLATNAVQFNHDGGEVRISARAEAGLVILTVSDTGPGIAREDLPRIFERFYRGDKSRGGGHAGLGLAICRAIIEAHGGTITAESEIGQGTHITARLPR